MRFTFLRLCRAGYNQPRLAPLHRIMPQSVFHAPDHDHTRCTADALVHAEAWCAQRAQRLTPIRRQVLEILLESHKPLGAYEIIDRAAVTGSRPASSGKTAASGGKKPVPAGTRPAPITVYRALDFLRDNGLVHRIESRNAFVACVNNHASGELVVFLICEHCGAVGEAPSAAVADQLKSAARSAGFTPKTPVIEISGVCAHCRRHEQT
jgi:Fur family transcriptional regulator, zinc uptake regulator